MSIRLSSELPTATAPMPQRPRAPRPRAGIASRSRSRAASTACRSTAALARTSRSRSASNSFIPGFEEQLIGIAQGETRTLKVLSRRTMRTRSWPASRPSSRPPRPWSRRRRTPGSTDEFAKTLGLESLDKLKEAARERLTAEFAGATRQRVKRMLLDRLDEAHRFEAPPSLVEEEFNLMWNSIKAEMESGGKTFADEDTTRRGRQGRVSQDRGPKGPARPRAVGDRGKRTRSRSPMTRSAAR